MGELVTLVTGARRSQIVGSKALPDVAAEFLRFPRKFGPSLLALRRGDQKANTYSNPQSGGKSKHVPTDVAVIVVAKSL